MSSISLQVTCIWIILSKLLAGYGNIHLNLFLKKVLLRFEWLKMNGHMIEQAISHSSVYQILAKPLREDTIV